jgi:hypothetical protein
LRLFSALEIIFGIRTPDCPAYRGDCPDGLCRQTAGADRTDVLAAAIAYPGR